MRKNKWRFLGILIGIFFILLSLIFEQFVPQYRAWMDSLGGEAIWELSLVGYLIYHVARWLGFLMLGLGLFWLFGFNNPKSLFKENTLRSNYQRLLRSVFIILLFGLLAAFYLVGYPPLWLNILIMGLGFSILIAKFWKPDLLDRVKTWLKQSKWQKIVGGILLGLSIGSLLIWILPIHLSPQRTPLYQIWNGTIYQRQFNDTYEKLGLFGWDYHYVEFHGPGLAWEPQAQMAYLDIATIRSDLIAASESGNFIRLGAHWFEIQPIQGGPYNWTLLDYCFDVIETDPNITTPLYVLLEIGPIKTSKIWVQASLPQWFPTQFCLNDPDFYSLVQPFVEAVVNRYKNRSCLVGYQLENEPDFLLHTFTDADEAYIITGDLYTYLNWLNSLVKRLDKDHLTAINIYINNINTPNRYPPVDLLLFDYYGTIPGTLPLEEYAKRWSTYIRPETGFGVAELQLNDWHAESPITNLTLETNYNACINIGMNIILWSELHTNSSWERSAINEYNEKTWKYYKVQEFWQHFTALENVDQTFQSFQIQSDWWNWLILMTLTFILWLIMIAAFVFLRRFFEGNGVNYVFNFSNHYFLLFAIPTILLSNVIMANPMMINFALALVGATFFLIYSKSLPHQEIKLSKKIIGWIFLFGIAGLIILTGFFWGFYFYY